MIASLRPSWMRRFAAGTAVFAIQAALGSAVSAQEAAPDFLKNLPVESVGTIAGFPAWKMGEEDFLWMKMPDGSIIAGYVFDAKGQDKGSALVGKTPVSVWETLGLPDPGQTQAVEGTSPVGTWEEMIAAPEAEPADLPALEIETAQISPEVSELLPPATEAEPADPLAAPMSADAEALLKDALAVTEETISTLPPDQKNELVAKLVLALEAAKTPEEFQLAIIRWNEEATGKKILPDGFTLPTDATDGSAPEASETPASSPDAMVTESAEDAAPAAEVTAVDRADPSKATNESLLADIRTNGFWFGVGAPDAPTVYMIADPACPYCARSIKNLREEVETGKLQIRILLAPFVSKSSPDLIASILLSADPAKAYLEHSLQYADRGASDLEKRVFKDLPEEMVTAVRGNYDMVGAYGLRGVPFFAWTTAEGAKLFNGVPNAGHFAAAIKDDYAGNRTQP